MLTQAQYAPLITVYSLTVYDYPLLKKAGFVSQGLFTDYLWATDRQNVLWQVSTDEDMYLKFYEHDADMKPASPRNMTRQEFLDRFGV